MVSAECAETHKHIKGLLVASFEMNTLLELHGNHTGVALKVARFFEVVLNRFRKSLIFREVLN